MLVQRQKRAREGGGGVILKSLLVIMGPILVARTHPRKSDEGMMTEDGITRSPDTDGEAACLQMPARKQKSLRLQSTALDVEQLLIHLLDQAPGQLQDQ